MNRINRLHFFVVILILLCAQGHASGREEQGEPPPDPAAGEAARTGEAVGAYPFEIRDDSGYTVRLERRPERIVSLTVFTDDILLEMVDHRRLLGVTTFSEDPAISNVVQEAAAIANKLTMNVELILSLAPDLVLVANWSEADKVAQLRNTGIPVYLIATALTVPAIQEKIRIVGRMVGTEDEARAMIQRMNERLSDIEERLSVLSDQQRLTVMDYANWGTAQGAGSSWDEIIRYAGLINAVGRYSADEWGQVPLSRETILELDPDLLILPGWIYGDPDGADAFYQQTVGDPALQGLSAIREQRVYRMPEGLKAATSQYIVDAVEYLAQLAYPQLFPE